MDPSYTDSLTPPLDDCEVHGHKKAGASYGYTKVLGYHPLLATRADTGEILHARMRKGSANTARGANRFVEELIARVRSCGATGGIVVRVDSGFWSNKTIATLGRLGVRFTMTVRSNVAINAAIAGIAEDAWTDIDYTDNGGAAQVAECAYKGLRLVVRRTRLAETAQSALFPTWRHHSFLTNLAAGTVAVDRFHRHHTVVELAIRDLKDNAGLDHVPSGVFAANGAWLACAVLAHNLIRWTAALGDLVPDDHTYTVGRTHRIRHVAMPARLVNRAGTLTLRAPARWPWKAEFTIALEHLRALQPATG
ncbi:IS1380 family transposase [Acidiferrimicrobium sp. IK]|uniref:IS1380 family transposase n=1 Tax=Acidiferrimicrobium sp. IK TaxID=2871700 RepID=UPI0021CAFC1A|nr:IS1380 family transposase [Acidiferrimicrobium sp. IK]MCU4187391.1 IS1380 family transposase [Acidiferrimicrobium sp. IK]